MKKCTFLETDSFYAECISNSLLRELKLFRFSSNGSEYFVKKEKRFITERDIAKEKLQQGKGVYYQGYIFLRAKDFHKNPVYLKYLKVTKERKSEYMEYLDGIVYENLKSRAIFPVVKSIIELYKSNFLTKQIAISKLNKYLNLKQVEILLN